MADSFADLWSTAAPSSAAPQKPRKLNDLISSTTPSQQTRPQNDLFALLAASNPSSNSNSRTSSPGTANQTNLKSNSPILPSPSNGDAFSGLLSDSFVNGTGNSGNLSMAEQAAKAERERRDKLSNSTKQTATKTQPPTWVGLESLGTTSSFTPPPKQATRQNQDDFDWLFDTPASASSKPALPSSPTRTPPTIATEDEDWGLSDFASRSTPAPAPSTARQRATKPSSIWDFEDAEGSNKPLSPPRRANRPNSPGEDFDFGNREDGLLDNDSNDERDILGFLSKPVVGLPPRRIPASTRGSTPKTHTNSPPPHIVGQIVEMGFGPTEARNALAATDTGVNVEAALEFLLAERESSGPSRASPAPPERRHNPPPPQDPQDNGPRPPVRRRPTDPLATRDKPPNAASPNVQTDKLLAQASEIGMNVFNKANALWSQGKEKVQKAYEERVNTTQVTTQQKHNGRPRWMQEETGDDSGNAREPGYTGIGFKDSDEEEQRPPPKRPAESKRQPSQKLSPQPPRPHLKTGDLLAEEPTSAYRSPFRHGSSSRTQTPQQAQPLPPKPTLQRTPSPIPITHRQAVSASATAIATCLKSKAAGTEMFKLGRYGEADTAYTSAIASLPESHLLQVQLYNNRALSRLKTGEHSGTIADCSFVISLIGPSYHPQREAKVTEEKEGSGVDLADGLMKAYKRRAEAYEGRERWEDARKDWEIIAGTNWANRMMRNEAISGIGRCRKILNPQPEQAVPKQKPVVKRPPPKLVIKSAAPTSGALEKLRAVTDAAEAEDQAKHDLKDAVDAKVIAWKGGKEQNIRALIASLENILWPELNWQKVGMHELVAPNQVKIRYTKAIAKLHPDKLNSNNTTVEQRMIANSVFGALNEAWNSFKP